MSALIAIHGETLIAYADLVTAQLESRIPFPHQEEWRVLDWLNEGSAPLLISVTRMLACEGGRGGKSKRAGGREGRREEWTEGGGKGGTEGGIEREGWWGVGVWGGGEGSHSACPRRKHINVTHRNPAQPTGAHAEQGHVPSEAEKRYRPNKATINSGPYIAARHGDICIYWQRVDRGLHGLG